MRGSKKDSAQLFPLCLFITAFSDTKSQDTVVHQHFHTWPCSRSSVVNASKQNKSFTEVQESRWGNEGTCKAALYLKCDSLRCHLFCWKLNYYFRNTCSYHTVLKKKKKFNKTQNLEIISENKARKFLNFHQYHSLLGSSWFYFLHLPQPCYVLFQSIWCWAVWYSHYRVGAGSYICFIIVSCHSVFLLLFILSAAHVLDFFPSLYSQMQWVQTRYMKIYSHAFIYRAGTKTSLKSVCKHPRKNQFQTYCINFSTT